jgi:hypothetical protein
VASTEGATGAVIEARDNGGVLITFDRWDATLTSPAGALPEDVFAEDLIADVPAP